MMKMMLCWCWCWWLIIIIIISLMATDLSIRGVGGASYTPGDFWQYYCPNNSTSSGRFTSGSTYEANLEAVISDFKSSNSRFLNLSSSSSSSSSSGNKEAAADSRVYAIGLCRGDASDTECSDCFDAAPSELRSLCGTSKEAIGWQENCMVRYSDRSNIFGTVETYPFYSFCNPEAATVQPAADPSRFNQTRKELVDELTEQAASGNSTLKMAIGNYPNETSSSSVLVLYGIAQCTPDLDKQQCESCLRDVIPTMNQSCPTLNSRGGRVYFPSCNFRYENNSFTGTDYTPPGPGPGSSSSSSSSPSSSSTPPPPPPSNGSGGKSRKTKAVVIVIVVIVSILLLVVVVVAFLIFTAKRKAASSSSDQDHIMKMKMKMINNNNNNNDNSDENDTHDDIINIESLRYDFSTIRAATNDFDETNFLGRGGFGTVYKGVLPSGRQIAVKRLERTTTLGKAGEAEFENEVLLVANLQHRNLVRLFGFSAQGQERLLIIEYLPKGSLDHLLFVDTTTRRRAPPLDWQTRFKIILGVARGLLYLHEDSRVRIIHRDLKAANVLLDQHLNPKIADFGTARLFTKDQTHADTNNIAGTLGYMAPEYGLRGYFSVKSDVYSFGVLLLEIILGQRTTAINHDGLDVLTTAWRKWNDGETILDVVDPVLLQEEEEAAPRPEIVRCIHIAFLCVQENVSDRPTMSSVLLMLSGQLPSLPIPFPPPYIGSTINIDTDAQSKTKTKTKT